MPVRIRVPAPLRPLTGGREEVEADGATVGEVFQDLESRHAGLASNILDNGQVRRFVTVYLNSEDIRFMAGLATPVNDGDTLSLVPAIATGRAG